MTYLFSNRTRNPYLPSQQKRQVSCVMQSTGALFGLTPAEMRQRSNLRSVVLPRSVAMYVMRQTLGLSVRMIGLLFGGKHHTTALHAIQKIQRLRADDSNVEAAVQLITEAVQTAKERG